MLIGVVAVVGTTLLILFLNTLFYIHILNITVALKDTNLTILHVRMD